MTVATMAVALMAPRLSLQCLSGTYIKRRIQTSSVARMYYGLIIGNMSYTYATLRGVLITHIKNTLHIITIPVLLT